MKELFGLAKALFMALLTAMFGLTLSLAALAYFCVTVYLCFARPASLEASVMFVVAILVAYKLLDFIAWFEQWDRSLENYLEARRRFEASLTR